MFLNGKKSRMQVFKQSVGVDISKSDFVAYFEVMLSNQRIKKIGRRKFDNTPSGAKRFVQWLVKKSVKDVLLEVVMEATGRYHEVLAYHLYEGHYRVCIVLPNRIKYFARSLNQFSKTDPIDAAVIARYGLSQPLEAWEPPREGMRRLRELSRERQDLVKMKTQAINRLHAMRSSAKLANSTIERLELQLAFFEQQIAVVEAEMNQLSNQDQHLAYQVKQLTSIPNIGTTSAYTILAETAGFQLFSNRNQLIKYAGLDVVENQSGTSIEGRSRISKRGNANLRAALYMPAVSALTKPSVFRDTYQRHLDSHKNKSKALMAVQRKLLLVAFGTHQSGQMYDEQQHRCRTSKQVGEHKGSPTVAHLVN